VLAKSHKTVAEYDGLDTSLFSNISISRIRNVLKPNCSEWVKEIKETCLNQNVHVWKCKKNKKKSKICLRNTGMDYIYCFSYPYSGKGWQFIDERNADCIYSDKFYYLSLKISGSSLYALASRSISDTSNCKINMR
jgi:hypothetical protein